MQENGTSDTIHMMNKKVAKALGLARQHAKGDEELLEFINKLEEKWSHDSEQIVLFCVALWSIRWKTKEQTLEYLRLIQGEVKSPVFPNTIMGSTLIN